VRAAVLPAALDLEGPGVEHREAAGAVAVGVAEHADHDVVAGHAVNGVGAGQSRLAHDLVGLDHLLDPRAAGIVGHVDDVDARRAEAGDDQVRPVRAVAGGAAAVPAEVVQLVAGGRHLELVHDPPVLGVHDGEEVGPPRALVEARDVEELLGGGLHGLGGGGVEGSRPVGVTHDARSCLRQMT
jgi:hypothetical protein